MQAVGYSLPLVTNTAVLGARPLAREPDVALSELREAIKWARGLLASLERPGVDVSLCVHVALAEVRTAAGGQVVVGGPICQGGELAIRSDGWAAGDACGEF